MIPKAYRGISPREVTQLIKQGRRTSFDGGVLYWRPTSRERPRIAVSIPKKTAPKATTRARLRRGIQAALRPLLPSLTRPADILIVWRRPVLPNPQALLQTLRALLTHIHLIN